MNKISTRYPIFLLILFGAIININLSGAQNKASRYAEESVLAKGKWVKIRVKQNGIYKLTYNDIKNMGFSDPAKVKIYGYGGWCLEQLFTQPYTDDLPEIAVWKSSKNGGFGSNDFLLFYGRGPIKWEYKSMFQQVNNPYDTYGYYFVTESEEGAKEMEIRKSYSGASREITVFDDYVLHERDSIAVMSSGRDLFGESFAVRKTQNFYFNIPGITNDEGIASLSFIAAPNQTEKVTLSIDGTPVLSGDITKTTTYKKANMVSKSQNWTGQKTENVNVNIAYSGTSGISYLNFILLNFKRKLQFYNNAYTFFRHTDSRARSLKYVIDNAGPNNYIWNITDPVNATWIETETQGNKIIFGASAGNGTIEEYVMIDTSKSFPTPEVVGGIPNQNLHGLEQVDMVIISPVAYTPYAEQLADQHRNSKRNPLKVHVVQPELIYNEFASGARDATAYRRFMKMFYDRANGNDEKPKYLLLYGDGFFDNRHISAEGKTLNPGNYLLTYQFENSIDENQSYGTDDYFGFLDDNEGINLGNDKLDIGIGRFPVNTVEQAKNAAAKVIAYMENKDYGKWQNSVIFAADDTGSDPFCIHASQADALCRYMETNYPEYIVAKSYMDAFQPIVSNGKKTYPDAKNKLLTTLKDGCLLMNYTGHGSPSTLSAEDMMDVSDIRNMSFPHLPLWITATCDFGWFDAGVTSAGEEVFLNKTSGGIALYTTTRIVNSGDNSKLNNRIIENLFPNNKKKLTLGEALKQSKLDVGNENNKLNFVLFGDPAMYLNYPEEKVVLESVKINGEEKNIREKMNFRALDNITLEGSVVDSTDNIMDAFNGELSATVFDGEKSVRSVTVNNGNHWYFNDYQNKIFMGNASIKDGRFSISFKIPLDISYNPENTGKINLYAWDENNGVNAVGAFLNYTLSGSNSDGTSDNQGPEIQRIYLNSEKFENGGTVHETPYFFAQVHDEDGINTAGNGLGHEIMIAIDNNPSTTYNLNSYYRVIDSHSGIVDFIIPELPAGEHQLTFKVWDILNNSTTDTLAFRVEPGAKPYIYDIEARPNPATTETRLTLIHDRTGTPMDAEIRIFDLAGRTVWTYKQSGSEFSEIVWPLTDGRGQKVQAGMYLYRAVISTAGGKEATKTKKIIVKGQ
ncbi:MAG: type IX secretion system sortase PorU [Dysgonamonadaceae bacterium]|jgi:hypothetical protein|nr:type IX secretion system sortase PorU [Dysgonamonadaceae bacterium]